MTAGQITHILQDINDGNREAEARLMEVVLPELRRRAAAILRKERPGHTLQTTALVNEVYLDLTGKTQVNWHDAAHFFAIAAHAMRRILVDHARRRNAEKRAGGRQQVELTDLMAICEERLDEALAVDEALNRLAELDHRQSQVVVMRFFGGLTEEEIALVLGVNVRTVKRDWKVARAWLHGELKRDLAKSSNISL